MKQIEQVKEWLGKRAKRYIYDTSEKDLASECAGEFKIGKGEPPEWLIKLAAQAINQAFMEDQAEWNKIYEKEFFEEGAEKMYNDNAEPYPYDCFEEDMFDDLMI